MAVPEARLSELGQWLETVKEIAVAAGDLITNIAGSGFDIRRKGPVDLVTEADIAAEKFVTGEINKHFPGQAVLAEEAGGQAGDGYLWVIDPIDGTTNFAHGFPVFSVSIGLMIDRESALGVVYEPNLKELFCAVGGGGATLNNQPIKVSTIKDLDESLLATGFPYSLRQDHQKVMDDFVRVSLACQGVRRAGAATLDLCNVACGRFDGFWEVGLRPWDTAAAVLIVLEAGGQVSTFDGSPFDHFNPEIVATNGELHTDLVTLLTK